MTARHSLDQIVRGLDERGATWGYIVNPDSIREIAAYVRDLEERLAKAAEALETISSPTQTDNLLWWQVQARTALTTIRRTE